jgi:hypothetical protein
MSPFPGFNQSGNVEDRTNQSTLDPYNTGDYLQPQGTSSTDYYFNQSTYQTSNPTDYETASPLGVQAGFNDVSAMYNPFSAGGSDYYFNTASYDTSAPASTGDVASIDYGSTTDIGSNLYSNPMAADYNVPNDNSASVDYSSGGDIGDNATGGVYTVGGPGPGDSGNTVSLVGGLSPGEVVAIIPAKQATKQAQQKISALVSGSGGGPQGLGLNPSQVQDVLNRIMALYAASKLQPIQPQQQQQSGGGSSGGSKGGNDQKPQQQQPQQDKGAPQQSRASGGSRGSTRNLTPSGQNAFTNSISQLANNLYGPNGYLTNSNFDYTGQFPYQPESSSEFDPFSGSYSGQTNFYMPSDIYGTGYEMGAAYNNTSSYNLDLYNEFFNPYGAGSYAPTDVGGQAPGVPFDISGIGSTDSIYAQMNLMPPGTFDAFTGTPNSAGSSLTDYYSPDYLNSIGASFNPAPDYSSPSPSPDYNAPLDYNSQNYSSIDNSSGSFDFSGGDASAATGGTFEVQNTDGGGTDSVGGRINCAQCRVAAIRCARCQCRRRATTSRLAERSPRRMVNWSVRHTVRWQDWVWAAVKPMCLALVAHFHKARVALHSRVRPRQHSHSRKFCSSRTSLLKYPIRRWARR